MPLLLPVIDSRRIRETARIVSTQFASAQSEAMAKGRPVGVWIERLGANDTSTNLDRSAAMDIYLCEVPQPYSGDSIDSRVTVVADTSSTPNLTKYAVKFSGDTAWYGLLRPGDTIRFNYRGPWYVFTSDTAEYQNQATNTLTAPDANGIKYLDNSAIKAIDRIRTSPTAAGLIATLGAGANQLHGLLHAADRYADAVSNSSPADQVGHAAGSIARRFGDRSLCLGHRECLSVLWRHSWVCNQ